MSVLFTFNGLTVISTPASPAPKSLSFTNTDFGAATNNPFAGSQQVVNWQASMLSAAVQLPPMTRAGGGALWSSFLMECKGMANAFLMGDPTGAQPQGSNLTTGATPLINGAAQNGYSLNTKGWQPSRAGVLKAGDWVQIIYRLHKVLDDVDSDASGNATLSIYPQIRETPADGSPLITTNTVGLFRLASSTSQWSIGEAAIYGFNFNIREAF